MEDYQTICQRVVYFSGDKLAWKNYLFSAQPVGSFLEGFLLPLCMHSTGAAHCAVQGKEQDGCFKIPNSALSSTHLSTPFADGMTYLFTHLQEKGTDT